MPSLEDAIKVLEGQENGSDLVGVVNSAIEAERNKGLEARTKANNEAKNLRDRLKATEPLSKALGVLGFDPEADDADPLEFADTIQATIDKAKKGELPDGYDITKHPDYRKLQRDAQKAAEQLNEVTTERDGLLTERNRGKIRNALNKALRDENGNEVLYATGAVIDNLILTNRVGLSECGEVVFASNDGEEIDFDTGLRAVLDENKSALRNPQRPGGGSGGGHDVDPSKQTPADRIEHLRKIRRGNII